MFPEQTRRNLEAAKEALAAEAIEHEKVCAALRNPVEPAHCMP